MNNNRGNDAPMEKSGIAKREEGVLAFWNEKDIFNKSVAGAASREGYKGEFVFYDGPPFATGTPHYGHLLQSAVKDAVPRYQTMRGYQVKRQWGWDCHGLPIENIVEKNLGTKSKKDIEALGVKKFNDACRAQIFTYVDEWNKFIPRFGRWADMEHPYRTMDRDYMESEWWAFKTLYEKGLVYEDYRTMHICPRCETTLSQSEVTEGYATVKDLALTVKFKIKNPEKIGLSGDVYILAWTTTPWTLPGNVALAVGKDVEYVITRYTPEAVFTETGQVNAQPYFILAKSIFEKSPNLGLDIAPEPIYGDPYPSVKGSELAGLEYEPLFDFYSKDESLKNKEKGWKVYAADFVTTDVGTGVVHIAPGFGSDDMALGKKENLPFVQHVGMDGVFKKETGEWAGKSVTPRYNENSVKENRVLDVEITNILEKEGKVFAPDKNFVHEYPLCWRCDTPLLNYATSSWFVAVEKIKKELLESAKDISWVPSHFKEGRWGQWLVGARDWSISRQRFWANTIPVWMCEECKTDRVFGSAKELEEASGKQVTDLHKDVVDEITVKCKQIVAGETCYGVMYRISDVLDTWFDSGSAPFATSHFMGEGDAVGSSVHEPKIPGDFIAEGQDQVSKWFYYQHVLSVGLFGKRAFDQVVSTGVVLAADGRKMAKRLKNYADPIEVIDKYGADAVRYYLLSSSIMRAENLNFDEASVGEISRKIVGRLVNVYEFYAMYVGDDLLEGSGRDSEHVLDRWIRARLNETIKEVTNGMEAYELDRASRPINDFVDDLSTWYLRRSRDRFKSENVEDKKAAIATLGFVLRGAAKIMAPFMPFIADWLWQQLRVVGDPESVHLADWPEAQEVDITLITAMKDARQVVTEALMVRNKANIKVRQPLTRLSVNAAQFVTEIEQLSQIIADEVNVKEVLFEKSSGAMTQSVMLDTTLTPELEAEGQVRDIVRAVQNLRKEKNLKPGEKAILIVSTSSTPMRSLIQKSEGEISRVASLSAIEFTPTHTTNSEKITNADLILTLR